MTKITPFFKTDRQSPSRMNWKKTRLNFGMYMGYTVQKIWEMDAQYLRWLLQNTDTLNLRKFEEDRIYEKALMEDEAQTKRAERRARRFFGGAREIRGERREERLQNDSHRADDGRDSMDATVDWYDSWTYREDD